MAAAPAWLPRAMRVRGDGVASRVHRATSRARRARFVTPGGRRAEVCRGPTTSCRRIIVAREYLDLGAGVDVGDVGGDAGGARDIVQGEFGHEGVLRRGKREEGQLRVRQIGADCPSVP